MPEVPSYASPEPDSLSPGQKTWRWRILFATYFGYGGYYLTRKVFGLCKTSLVEEFDWNLSDTANIWTVYLVAYMLGQFLNSFIGRKWGPRVLLLGGLGQSIVCSIIFGFSNSYQTFLVFMFYLESTVFRGLGNHATRRFPSVLVRSIRFRRNFTKIAILAEPASNSGNVFLKAMATTCSEGATPGRIVRIHEPNDCQTDFGVAAERI